MIESASQRRLLTRSPILLALLGFLLIDLVFINSLPAVELLGSFTQRVSLWFLPFFVLGGLLIACSVLLAYPGLAAEFFGRLRTGRQTRPAQVSEIPGKTFERFFYINLYLTIFLGLVVARLLVPYLDEHRVFRDTELYVTTAEIPITDPAFWSGERSFTLPLVYKLLGVHSQNFEKRSALDRVGDFQAALATFSWVCLGLSLAAALRTRWLRPVAFGLVAFFSLSLDLILWDRILLTESVSNSLFALWVAGWILAVLAWSNYPQVHPALRSLHLLAMLAVTVLFTFIRDTNAYLVLAFAGLMLVGLLLPQVRRHPGLAFYLLLLSGLMLVYLTNSASVVQGRRWQVPFYDLLAGRLLIEPPARAYFEAQGMPVTPEILALSSLEPWQWQGAIRSDPRYAALKEWVDAHGRSTYLKYLLSQPVASLRRPLAYLADMASPDTSEYRNPLITPPTWEWWLTRLFYPHTVIPLLLVLGFLALIMVFLAARQQFRAVWLVPLALLAAAFPLMFLIWHGGTLELGRHAVGLALQLRLAGWMMVVMLGDFLAEFLTAKLYWTQT